MAEENKDSSQLGNLMMLKQRLENTGKVTTDLYYKTIQSIQRLAHDENIADELSVTIQTTAAGLRCPNVGCDGHVNLLGEVIVRSKVPGSTKFVKQYECARCGGTFYK